MLEFDKVTLQWSMTIKFGVFLCNTLPVIKANGWKSHAKTWLQPIWNVSVTFQRQVVTSWDISSGRRSMYGVLWTLHVFVNTRVQIQFAWFIQIPGFQVFFEFITPDLWVVLSEIKILCHKRVYQHSLLKRIFRSLVSLDFSLLWKIIDQ